MPQARPGFPPLTGMLVVLCIMLSLYSGFGSSPGALRPFFLTGYYGDTGIEAVFAGEIWRLVTPIFLHFGLIHIVFNMLWLWQLGGALEVRLGWSEVLLLILVFAIPSNVAQYGFEPRIPFGGMSGVVYGLLGYFWAQGKYNPRFGMRLHRPIVIMMLVWFVICWSGLVGNIANMAHSAGLALGVVTGYLSARFGRP